MLLDLLQTVVLTTRSVLRDVVLAATDYSLVAHAYASLNAHTLGSSTYFSEPRMAHDTSLVSGSMNLFAMDHALDDPRLTLT